MMKNWRRILPLVLAALMLAAVLLAQLPEKKRAVQ